LRKILTDFQAHLPT